MPGCQFANGRTYTYNSEFVVPEYIHTPIPLSQWKLEIKEGLAGVGGEEFKDTGDSKGEGTRQSIYLYFPDVL